MSKRMIAPLLIGLVGAGILIWLGSWQLQRLTWKQEVLARIEGMIHSAPASLPTEFVKGPRLEWQFAPVKISGRFTGEELHVLASTREAGAIYRIITAFETTDGRRILVDRGYVGTTRKDAHRPAVDAVIIGNIHYPDEVDSFTPEVDQKGKIWFARDVAAMSEVLKTEELLVVLRETSEADSPVVPLPLVTAGIPNNHLNYAITWFLFAVVWLGMTGYWLWRIRRRLD